MKYNKIIAFGDSWARGVGANLYLEKRPYEKFDHQTAKTIERKIEDKYSWPRLLSRKLNIDYHNVSEVGNSNDIIVNEVLKYHRDNFDNKNELYIIMWSSGLRNELHFIPSEIRDLSKIGIAFDYKSAIKQRNYQRRGFNPFFEIQGNLPKNDFMVEKIEPFYKEFVDNMILNDVIDYSYFDFLNQMQIYFLQQYFQYFKINYIMCDAFESMFSYSDKVKSFINLEYYYKPPNETNFMDYIENNGGESYFENYGIEKKYRSLGNHPNKKGYEMISNLLYEFISKKYK